MAEAIFYLVRSGCAWRMLPRHFPPWPTVPSELTRWRPDGTLRRMHDRLRERARKKAGRDQEPFAAMVDAQTARATGAGGPERGFDAGKKAFGRKRHLLVDASGLILLAHIHSASLHDTVGARKMIEAMPTAALPRLELVWADGAYRPIRTVAEAGAWLACRDPVPSSAAGVALRSGGASGRLPCPPTPVGGRENVCLARPLAPPRTRLRAPARDWRGDDPRRHEPHHAWARRMRAQQLCRQSVRARLRIHG